MLNCCAKRKRKRNWTGLEKAALRQLPTFQRRGNYWSYLSDSTQGYLYKARLLSGCWAQRTERVYLRNHGKTQIVQEQTPQSMESPSSQQRHTYAFSCREKVSSLWWPDEAWDLWVRATLLIEVARNGRVQFGRFGWDKEETEIVGVGWNVVVAGVSDV